MPTLSITFMVDLRRTNTAPLPVGSVVAPHRQANAKADESTTFKFFFHDLHESAH